jgi:ATP-dependent Lon protease
MSAEATVVRNYLDWLLNIPWKKRTRIKKSITHAHEVLDADHYGLEKVKERILEYLAVQQRIQKIRGPILCLVGPPGVGKTSLGKSIARATGRNFVRMSLGGVRDEAEVRGHRRTYIGSMPGKVIQGMKKAKSSNPLFLLDEVDKLGSDWRGDPSSALLEVLDPEQNNSFNDHYLEVDYDLSDVMFVTTANTLRMPPPLMDRMEIIRIPGYTEDEKVEIAKRHLIPKQMKLHGLKGEEWSISEEALRDVIRYYTREAGVRNLERELAGLNRKSVKVIAVGECDRVKLTRRNLEKFAGVPRYRYGELEQEDLVGVATGLAWTEVGGELLSIEAVTVPGKGKVISTGKLGERIDPGGRILREEPLGRIRHQADPVRQEGHSRPRAGGRYAQGRALGGRGHGDGHRFRLDRHSGAPRCRHDRRDHVARTRVADRRAEGKAAGGAAWRPEDRRDPEGQREGSGGDSRQREAWPRDLCRELSGRGVEAHAGQRARANRVERIGRTGVGSRSQGQGRAQRLGDALTDSQPEPGYPQVNTCFLAEKPQFCAISRIDGPGLCDLDSRPPVTGIPQPNPLVASQAS